MLSPTDLVLVAILPSPRDLEIARVLGWYRIPLATAPKVVAVDYLAFYQPASFKEHKWRIEWIAPVKGHELATRGELLKDEQDHPHVNEEYFKLQLGSLEELPRSIPAAKTWKRVTFLYTTGDRLLQAESINDLSVHDEERQILWRALRERALEKQSYQVHELPEFLLDPNIIAHFGLMDVPHIPKDDL